MTRPCSRCGRETAVEDLARKGATSSRTWCKPCDSRRAKARYFSTWSAKREHRNELRRLNYHANKPAAESG